MELTQQDYEERKAHVDDGTADDEDRRLVKHYERQGFTLGDDGSSAVRNPFEDTEESEQETGTSRYAAMTKRELVAELETRKDANGGPLVFDRSARNDALIACLEENDRDVAARAAGE
jgi:hypothetical protein